MIPRLRSLFNQHRTLAVLAILVAGSIGLFGWVRNLRREPTVPSFKVQPEEFWMWSSSEGS